MTTLKKEAAPNTESPSLSASEARSKFNDLVNRVRYGGERVTITRQGKPAAVLVSIEDMALLAQVEDRLWGDLALGRLEDEWLSGASRIAWNDLKRELDL